MHDANVKTRLANGEMNLVSFENFQVNKALIFSSWLELC